MASPCNICQVEWPRHHKACAYLHTATERDRYRKALESIATLVFLNGKGEDPRDIAREALGPEGEVE